MYLLFQSVPKRYNLAKDMRAGERDTWLVTRYMDEIKTGDTIFFWMAGPPEIRGLYGWGSTLSAPSFHSNWGYGVDVFYKMKFPRHIAASDVQALQSFSDFVLFKMAIGTNFRLSSEQADALGRLIADEFGPGYAP